MQVRTLQHYRLHTYAAIFSWKGITSLDNMCKILRKMMQNTASFFK